MASASAGFSRFGPPPTLSHIPPPKPPPAAPAVIPAATKTERFLLTAADQESGSRDERLNRVIRSKYEAGLLKPYNYVKGYARLSRWMDRKCVLLHVDILSPIYDNIAVFRKNLSSRYCSLYPCCAPNSVL
jgi:hypothetical protein